MDQQNERKFLELYQKYRYNHQLDFYSSRQTEFGKAQKQVITGGIVLMFIAAIAGIVASTVPGLKLAGLLVATICPVLYTALTAYSTLYAFERQEKLYKDTYFALLQAHTESPDIQQGLDEKQFADGVDKYVHKVENIFLVEQGQWGQLTKEMKVADT